LIAPTQFIPQAEASGLIVPMTEWAMREAFWSLQTFELSRCLNSGALDRTQITVNISAKQLLHDNFLVNLRDIAELSSSDVERLSLEITESVLMACPDEAATKLKHCRDLGFGVSIDDFGTGYSSLSYLSKLPVSKLKLDGSFVRNLDESDVNRKIVQCILGLAQGLRLPVVAEGVEQPQEVEALSAMGCEQAQGFYFGKPLDSTGTLQLIKTWKAADRQSAEPHRAAVSYGQLHAQLYHPVRRNPEELDSARGLVG
jgi:EAL domain-containing protein (putative c-di-GMP-specific phosphodiesterase class I)